MDRLRPSPASLRSGSRTPSLPTAALAPVLGAMLALFMVVAFVVLDYRFEQAPHRLVKILVGGAVMATILIKPRLGLYVIPVILPFIPWIPPLPIPGVNPLNILLGSVFLTWALYRVLNRETVFRPGRLSIWLAAIVGVAALSIVRGAAFPTGYTYEVKPAVLDLFRSAVTFTIYYIVLAMARGERDRRWLTWAIVVGFILESVVTIAYGRAGRGARAEGSFGQANELGAFLAICTVFTGALLTGARSWFARGLLMAGIVAGVYASILTVSRGAMVSIALGLVYVAIRSSRLMLFVLLAVVLTGPLWAPDYLVQRITGTQVEVEGTDEAVLEGSAQARLATWRAIIQLVSEHPLDGVGFTGLHAVLPDAGDEMGVYVAGSAHNTYLRVLGEMGIVGLTLFVVILWKMFQLGNLGMRAAATRFDRQLALGVSAATMVVAISCAFGDRFFGIMINGNLWIACALVDDLLLEKGASKEASSGLRRPAVARSEA